MARRRALAADAQPSAPVEGATESDIIRIRPIELEVIDVRVKGLSPLIQHAWDPKAQLAIEEKQQLKTVGSRGGQRGRGAERKPKQEWHAARYLDEHGRDCARATQFKKATVSAALDLGLKKVALRSGIFVTSTEWRDLVPLEFVGKEPRLRMDMVRVGGYGGTATPRYRPEYLDWGATIRIQFRHGKFSAEQIVNCINEAGFGIGIGDYRPERDGEYGRFEVVQVRSVRLKGGVRTRDDGPRRRLHAA